MRGLCLFGGTFDPPHRTHHRIAATALLHLDPESLWVVPCGDHPLKDPPVAAAEHRLAMCRLAFADLGPRVVVSDVEVRRAGPSYTVDTVRFVRRALPADAPLWLLVGSDNLRDLDRWHEPEALRALATIVVVARAGEPLPDEVSVLPMAEDAVSSTAIRAALAAGEPPLDLQPEVLAYIREHGLYGS